MHKPFSEACERNKAPILAALTERLGPTGRLLEVGSGTGQHAVHCAAALPGWHWQPSDQADYLPGIRQWIDDAALPNLAQPLELDVRRHWPGGPFNALFTANTCHIMSSYAVECLLRGAGRVLAPGGWLVIYGPFRDVGHYDAPSNLAFDRMLRQRDPLSGLRDVEALQAMAAAAGLQWQGQQALPANNRCLFWRRGSAG